MADDEANVNDNMWATGWDALPADLATSILRSAGGPAALQASRATSKGWALQLDALIKRASRASCPASSSCSILQRLPHLVAVDLVGVAQPLPAGVLVSLLGNDLPRQLQRLALSTWSLATAPVPPTCTSSSNSSGVIAATTATTSAAAAAAAAAARGGGASWHLEVPRELGCLSSLQQLIIAPAPGVSAPAAAAMVLPADVMRLQALTRVELHSFLPACHHLRGMTQLQRLAISAAPALSGSGLVSAVAVCDAAAAAITAAPGLTSLRVQLQGQDISSTLDSVLHARYSCSGDGSSSSSSSAQGMQQQELRQLEVAGAAMWHLPLGLRHAITAGVTQLVLSHNRLNEAAVEPLGASSPQLLVLRLDHNSLRALPFNLCKLQKLQVLDVAHNSISSVAEACQLPSLRELRLAGNVLTALPDAISLLTALTALDIASNRLQELPEGLGCCTALAELTLARNRLVALPPLFPQLCCTSALDLTANHLEFVPPGLGNLSCLSMLALGLNYFKRCDGLDVAALASSLQSLEVPHAATVLDDAAGFLAAIGQLTSLTQLIASSNQLADVPAEWHALKRLQVLVLAHNAVEVLPPGLLQLPALRHLDISYNRLRLLPPWLSRIGGGQLRALSLARNHLMSLPAELAQQSGLSRLELQGNNIAALPDAGMCLPASLRHINLGANYKLKDAGLAAGLLACLPHLRDAVLPFRLGSVGDALRAAGTAVLLE